MTKTEVGRLGGEVVTFDPTEWIEEPTAAPTTEIEAERVALSQEEHSIRRQIQELSDTL